MTASVPITKFAHAWYESLANNRAGAKIANAPPQTMRASSMTISMYQVSVPVFLRNLTALNGVLDKAAAFAEAKKFDQAVLLSSRLYPDMFPLNVQVGQVCTHAARCVALLAIAAARFRNTGNDHRGAQGTRRQDDR